MIPLHVIFEGVVVQPVAPRDGGDGLQGGGVGDHGQAEKVFIVMVDPAFGPALTVASDIGTKRFKPMGTILPDPGPDQGVVDIHQLGYTLASIPFQIKGNHLQTLRERVGAVDSMILCPIDLHGNFNWNVLETSNTCDKKRSFFAHPEKGLYRVYGGELWLLISGSE